MNGNDYRIESADSLDMHECAAVSALYRQGIPQSLLARLHPAFFSKFLFYGLRDGVCSILVLRNSTTNDIGGFIIYSDKPGWKGTIVAHHKIILFLEAAKNLLNPRLWDYALHFLAGRLAGRKHRSEPAARARGGSRDHRAELFAIAVSGELRKQGWGKRLITELEARLQAVGCREYFILTLNSNEPSNALYSCMGATIALTHGSPHGRVNEYRKSLGSAQ
jgi:ribosomal protein S18 acetylase RimI-like enzyme